MKKTSRSTGARTSVLALVMVVGTLVAPSVAGAQRSPDPDRSTTPLDTGTADTDVETVPGRVVVTWEPGTSSATRADVRARHGVRREETFDAIETEIVSLPAEATERVIAALKEEPGVVLAEPDFLIEPTTNDLYYGHLWGIHNTGQFGGTADVDVDAPEAWAVTRGSSEVIVAVIDTGIDITHPDLASNIWTNPGEIAGNGIDDDGNGYVDDINGWDFVDHDGTVYDDPAQDRHGTHVAGTIAAVADNGIGVTGVAPNVTIMPVKFLGGPKSSGSGTAAAAAVKYATDNGATVINASWGGGGGTALKNAITAATGSVVVAAAGNEAIDMDTGPSQFPAAWAKDSYAMPNVLSVASVNRTGSLSSFSNHGLATVDVGAPGGDIVSTRSGGGYATMSGTSMAAPHGSGAAALVASLHPSLGGGNLAAVIKAGAQPLAALSGKTTTGGLVNARAALAAAASETTSTTSPPPPSDTDAEPESPPGTDPTEDPPAYDGTGARSLEWACPGVSQSGFDDVPPGSTHAAGVGCALEWRVFTGSSTGLFGPNASLTRGQLASVLVRALEQALGRALPEGDDRFVDDDSSVHRSAIDKLAELGIVTGLDATTYGPGASVTRGQFATMLARTYRHLAGELQVPRDAFGDDDGSVHEPAINGLAALGIVAGATDGRFQPGTNLSRAQSATLVARLLDALVEAQVVARPAADR